MAGGAWQISNRPNAGSAASASQTAAGGGHVNRLRSFQVTIAGTVNGTDQWVIRDGASGVGAIILQGDLAALANDSKQFGLSDLDIRCSQGNQITIEFVNGAANCRETVTATGDIVPVGYPVGVP